MIGRSIRPNQRNLIFRQIVVVGWIASMIGSAVGTFGNVSLVLVMSIVWEVLWFLTREMTKGLRISVVRLFLILHVVLVQVGLVAIYIYSQDAGEIAGLQLGFRVQPSLVAVLFPTAFVTLMLPGIWLGSHRPPREAAPLSTERIGPVRRRRMVIFFVLMFVWGAAAFGRAGFPILTAFGFGESSETARIDYHYGAASSFLFNPSIVAQTYLAVCPFLLFALWRSTKNRTAGKILVYVLGGCLVFLVGNSLERTTPAILAIWFLLAMRAGGKRAPAGILVGGPAMFLAGTFVLHGGSTSLIEVIKLQVLRRVFVVNSMVNYFAIERFGSDLAYRFGSTYTEYFSAIARGGGGFSHDLITIIYPATSVGTAPVGLIAEAWVNFGPLALLLAPIVGLLFRALDAFLVHRNSTALGQALWAGVAVLVATMSYSAPLSTLFSGGLLFVCGSYLISKPPSLVQVVRPRATIGVA